MKGFNFVTNGTALGKLTIVSLALLIGTTAMAQDGSNDTGIRKFYLKKDEAPPPPPPKPAPGDQDNGEPIAPQQFKIGHSLRTLVDFPKYYAGVSYQPEYVGMKQTLEGSGQDFTLSQFSLLSLVAFAGVRMNDALSLTLDTSYATFGVSSQAFSTYQIDSSTPSLQNTHLTVEYCIANPNDPRKRWCPFAQIGIESFLAFEFTGISDLTLKSINDMLVGAGVNYEFPLTPLMTGRFDIAYIQGLVTGQTGNTQLNSDHKWAAGFSADYVFDEKWTLIGGVNFEDREYESQSVNQNNTDKFNGTLTSFIFTFTGKYNF